MNQKHSIEFILSGDSSKLKNVLNQGEQHVKSFNTKVKNDFADMARHATAAIASIAAGSYALSKLNTGVAAAATIQESMIDVKLNLMEAGKSVRDLDADLAKVKKTAVEVSKTAPFSAQEVIDIENTFLKAGLDIKDITAQGGAAWAASALATLSKEAPKTIADAMVTMAVPFNIKGGQYGELADYLQKVDQASVTTIPELMEGMKYVSGTAALMKVGWQNTLRAMGVVAQSGLRGSMGGTSLNDFFLRLNGTSRETRKIMVSLNHELAKRGGGKLEFFDKAGKMRALPTIINDLRNAMSKLNDHEKMFVLEKIFGEQGGRAAAALIKGGEGSWESIGKSIEKAGTLQDKMEERLKGYNANAKALSGTVKTTLGTMFDPVLAPAAKFLKTLNDIVARIGEIGDKNPALNKAVSYGGVAVGGAAAAGAIFLAYKNSSAFFKKIGGTATGIAEGKALEAAAGVMPVFVTNMPSTFGGGSEIPGAAKPSTDALKKAVPWAITAAEYAGVAVVGSIGSATALAILMNEINRQEMGDDAMIHIARSSYRNSGSSAAGKAMLNNEINMIINVDRNDRVTTNVDGMSTNVNAVSRGKF